MKTLRLALLGFGNAGQAFVQMLREKHSEICQKYDADVRISAVATGHHGSIVNADGMAPADVLRLFQENGQFPDTVTAMDIVAEADYDMLMELTPLNIRTGQPAIDHIRGAFARGKHVVTANKGPIVWAYDELYRAAQDIQDTANHGKVIKLLCRAWRENGAVHTCVQPAEVPLTSLEATIDATSSLVSITTDLMGKVSVVEHNPLIQQTAYGVFSDLLRVIKIIK